MQLKGEQVFRSNIVFHPQNPETAYFAWDSSVGSLDTTKRKPGPLAGIDKKTPQTAGWQLDFDRVLAVHVLEHLRNLPAAVREVHRVCDRKSGLLQVVIPCEGGLAYSLARRISAQRIFEKRYRQPYGWFIEREHVSQPHEILEELAECFTVEHRAFFPLLVPSVQLNLCIGLTLRPR
jgi:SAM-dependent methyltransferase